MLAAPSDSLPIAAWSLLSWVLRGFVQDCLIVTRLGLTPNTLNRLSLVVADAIELLREMQV